jgi:hypothetical protein
MDGDQLVGVRAQQRERNSILEDLRISVDDEMCGPRGRSR